jgi:hypothetical protein
MVSTTRAGCFAFPAGGTSHLPGETRLPDQPERGSSASLQVSGDVRFSIVVAGCLCQIRAQVSGSEIEAREFRRGRWATTERGLDTAVEYGFAPVEALGVDPKQDLHGRRGTLYLALHPQGTPRLPERRMDERSSAFILRWFPGRLPGGDRAAGLGDRTGRNTTARGGARPHHRRHGRGFRDLAPAQAPGYLGRITAVVSLCTVGLSPVIYPVVGVVTAAFGAPEFFAGCGAICLLAAAVAITLRNPAPPDAGSGRSCAFGMTTIRR